MTLPIFKNGDTLFTVIYRDSDAKNRLGKWASSSKSIQARVEDNRMYLLDHNTLSMFLVTWTHSWDNINIWDNWAKRHINF